jgi:hypothetical protein
MAVGVPGSSIVRDTWFDNVEIRHSVRWKLVAIQTDPFPSSAIPTGWALIGNLLSIFPDVGLIR